MTRILVLLAIGLAFLSAAPSSASLELVVHNVKSEKGVLWIGIYDSEELFLDRDHARLVSVPIDRSGTVRVVVPDVSFGEIAIAVFHDRNNNGELDRSLAGIPSEPFAFSGKVKSRWRLPRFEEVKVPFRPGNTVLGCELRTWWQF